MEHTKSEPVRTLVGRVEWIERRLNEQAAEQAALEKQIHEVLSQIVNRQQQLAKLLGELQTELGIQVGQEPKLAEGPGLEQIRQRAMEIDTEYAEISASCRDRG